MNCTTSILVVHNVVLFKFVFSLRSNTRSFFSKHGCYKKYFNVKLLNNRRDYQVCSNVYDQIRSYHKRKEAEEDDGAA